MDLVKYHNDINTVSFSGFSEKELNMFFTLVFLAKEEGGNELVIPFSELKKLSDGDINSPRFLKTLKTTYDKLIKISWYYTNSNGFGAFVLFNKYFVDEKNLNVSIRLNNEFKYLFNDLLGNFTKFDLLEFVSLKSSYSKNLFKILKQWESIKSKEFSVENFRIILGVPINYKTSDFNRRVLTPILEELPCHFHNLNLEKIKTGRKVTHLKFTWSHSKQQIKEAELIEIVISEKINNAIDKAKKNKFIDKLLNDDNIKVLVDKFNEKDLIKGLLWAYKEIKTDISSINYLIKSIKTGAEQTEKKIIIKDKDIPSKVEIISEPINVIEVTQEEYEELYRQHLKENDIRHTKHVRSSFDISNSKFYKIIVTKNDKDDDHTPPPFEKIKVTCEEKEKMKKEFTDKLDGSLPFKSFETLFKEKYYMSESDIEKEYEKVVQHNIQQMKIKEDIHLERTNYLKKLKTIELQLILKGDNRVEEFKQNFAKFFQLHDMIMDDYNILDVEIATKIEAELKILQNFFEQFEPKEVKEKILDIKDIPVEKLLSKKGTPLFGGALISRLGSIAKELKSKIKYKDKFIG